MARTYWSYNLRWNKDHYNFACKRSAARTNTTSTRAKGRMGSRERGDYISHGYLENYLARIAFVPFLQVLVIQHGDTCRRPGPTWSVPRNGIRHNSIPPFASIQRAMSLLSALSIK